MSQESKWTVDLDSHLGDARPGVPGFRTHALIPGEEVQFPNRKDGEAD